MTANTLPVDSNSKPASGGFDPTTQHVVAQKMGPAQTTSGTEYAPAIVNIADPTTPANQLAVNSLGQIAISNFPATQSIIGTVSVAQFPSVQVVSGNVDVSDRAARQLGHVIVDLGGAGTNTAPGYSVIQDGVLNTRKMAVNADGSINISGTISATNPSVGTTGTSVPASATYLGANRSGNIVGLTADTSNYLNVNVQTGTVTATNPSVGTDGSAIPTSATLVGASDGTNLQQLLVESSSNRNLRTGIYSGANEATVTGANALKVDNSAVTQPVSAASLPLPTGASTAAKQPALGTAGTASTDVITVQGIASMTAVKTDGSGVTQPISGTITANIGTTNGLALDTSINGVIVAQASTTSGQKGPLIQGAVTTGSPSYTTAQTSPISLTTAGAVRVDASATTQPISGTVTANAGTGSFTVAQATGSNLHAVLDSGSTTVVTQATASSLNAQVVGSVASAGSNAGNPVKVGGAFNTAQPTVTNGQIVDAQYTARGAAIVATGVDTFAVNASQSGTWTIQPGNTANTTPWLATINQGGNSATVTASNALKVDGSAVTQPISGTITANVGTTNGLALDTSVNGIIVAQGSTTSGEKGPLIQGAVTTSSPSYTTAQTSPISLTTAGAIRVDASATTQPVSGSGNFTVVQATGTNLHTVVDSGSITANAGTNLNTSLLALESGGNLASAKADLDNIKTYTSAFADTSATGTVTNDGDVVSISLPGGQATVLANILIGSLVGTLLFEASPDSGTTWISVSGAQAGTSSIATSTTAAGVWRIGVAGFTNFRIRLHPTTSGTSGTITVRVTQGTHNVAVVNTSTLGQTTMANSAPVVLASDEIVPIKNNFTEVASLSAGSLNADLVSSTDVSAYKWLSLHINTNAYSGTLTFQASNDNVNFSNTVLNQTNAGGGGNTSTTSTNVVYYGPISFRYFRVRMTAYTSGTAQGTLELYTLPSAISGISASQNGTWTVQPGNTQNTTPWLVNLPSSDITVFASGAQTATQTQADQTNTSAKGIKVVLDMTNVASSPSVTLEIDGKDVASGKYYSILTGAAVTTVSTNVYTIYQGLTASANAVANDVLPHTWRIKVTANNSNSGTYSVGASLIP